MSPDHLRTSRSAHHSAGIPGARALGTSRPGRLAGGILDASGVVPVNAAARARPERAHHPVLRGPRTGEPARRPRHRGGLLLPPPAPGPGHQAAADGRRHAGGHAEGVCRDDRRPDRAPGRQRARARACRRPERLPLLQAPGTGRGRVGRAVHGVARAGRRHRRPAARLAAASPWRRASSC